MGVIQIRQRTERLGNLPGVMRADVRTGGAEALAAQARAMGADGAARAGLVGDALKGTGALLGIAAKIAERNEHEEATAAANAYMAEKRAFYEGASDGAGSFVPGYLSKGVENPGSYVTGAAEADAEMKERHFGKLGRRQRELAERAVQGFDIQTQRAVTHRAQEAWTARRVKAADEFMGQTALNAVRLGPDADANLAASTWGAWEDSVEEAMDVRGIHGEAERAEFRRKAAQGVVNAAFARRVAEIRESCAGLEDEGEASKAWDDLEDGIGELGWEAIAGGGVKDAEGREIGNPLRRMLAGTDEEKLKADALETVRRERERSKREARANLAETQRVAKGNVTKAQLAFLEKNPYPEGAEAREKWANDMADMYDYLAGGSDGSGGEPGLSDSDRVSLRDTARQLRESAKSATAAEARAKDKAVEKASADAIKANEENLARSLATLDLLKMEGSLSQDDANDAQAAIWRKFRTLSLGKQLSPSFMRSFESRLSGELSDQEANAMRKFYQAFGFSAELDKSGEPTATTRKDAKNDSEDYYAPLEEEGVKVESRKTRIKAADLLAYGDTLLRTLRALGPDMNREGVVEREIARLKTGWMKGELDKNRDATVRSVMDMQRETRTRWEMAQPDKRSGEDDGRKEDGKPAK